MQRHRPPEVSMTNVPTDPLTGTAAPRRRGRSAPLLRALRRAAAAAAALGIVATALLVTGSPAQAAGNPTLITIAGGDLAAPIAVPSDGKPDLFNALLRQLAWMQGAVGTPMAIDASKLGSKYTVTLSAGADAAQVYDIYPAAVGGPRAFRPAAQPQAKSTDAWFYAAISLPDVLRAAGVPLLDTGPDFAGLDQAGLQGGDVSAESVARIKLKNELRPLR